MSYLISIIVPIYKIENYIRQCVDSILAQTYENIEVILVDDGSPDCCPAICDEYAAKDGRIKVVHKENGGLMSARQAGLRVATGDYVGFVDGDDWIEKDMYLTFAEYIEKYHPDMLFCEFLYSYEDREEKSGQNKERAYFTKQQMEQEIYPTMLFKAPYYSFGVNPCCWSKVFKKELLERCLYKVTTDIKIGEDAAFTYPALLMADSLCYIDKFLYHYRINPQSMTKTYDANAENYMMIPYDILKSTFASHPYDLSEQLNYYLLYLVNGIVRNEANPNCKRSRKEKMATLSKFAKNEDVIKAARLVNLSILPLHTKFIARFLASKNVNLLYLYSVLLRRFL